MAIVTAAEVQAHLEAAGNTLPASALTFIQTNIPRVTRLVAEFLKWEPEQATRTEYYPAEAQNGYFDGDELVGGADLIGGVVVPRVRGDRSRAALRLVNLPVRSIIEVRENVGAWHTGEAAGSFDSDTILSATNYAMDLDRAGLSWTGILWRTSGLWPQTPRSVKVTYVSGLSADELDDEFSDIKLAVIEAVSQWTLRAIYRAKGATGGLVQQLSIKDFSVAFAPQMTAGWALPDEVKEMLSHYISIGGLI